MLSRLSRAALSKQPFFPAIQIFRLSSDDKLQVSQEGYNLTKISETHTIKTSPDPGPFKEIRNIISIEEKVNDGYFLDEAATKVDSPVPNPLPFDGPQRDHVNFPRPVLKEFPAPTRLSCIPENWFQFLYPKLGVTGGYTLLLGLYLFGVQKEILITDEHDWKHLMAWFMWVYVFCRSELGVKAQYYYSLAEQNWAKKQKEFEHLCVSFREEAIAQEKEEQRRLEGKNKLYEAKKENVQLQLEAVYRESALDMYHKVKKRMDYLVEVANIDERIKKQYMVNWVVDQVNQSLAKTSEKETLKQCINDLNALAARV